MKAMKTASVARLSRAVQAGRTRTTGSADVVSGVRAASSPLWRVRFPLQHPRT
ncbi:hypothetical protein [Actinacidiphila glaucinigra]|uniref:hypothetical protein n=1 Tax=Actinacidiphila glaucinigra TaxID=235986 RepID=UPI003816BAE5